ncbi:MAG: MazG-like family protein [Candidatus Aenigmatarchaeota archaeon]
MSISVEASELMEHFIWEDNDEAREKLKDGEKFQEVKNELADIFNFSFMMADELDVDIVKIIKEKIKENRKKYPPKKAKGTSKKYTELSD